MARINKDELILAIMKTNNSNESIFDKVIKQFKIRGFKVEVITIVAIPSEKVITFKIDDKYIIQFYTISKVFEYIDKENFYDKYYIPYKKSSDVIDYFLLNFYGGKNEYK